jgi:hypothetical protein
MQIDTTIIMKNVQKTLCEQLKEWWMSRHHIINIVFGIAISTVYVRIIILDYGLNFRFKLPWWLNELNPINWITHRMLKWTQIDFNYAYWRILQWKSLELQVCSSYQILEFDYKWKVHCDHWGHSVNLVVAGVDGHVQFYDNRHWDYDKDEPLYEDSPERYEQSLVGWHKWAYRKARELPKGRYYVSDDLMVDVLAERCAKFEREQQERTKQEKENNSLENPKFHE